LIDRVRARGLDAAIVQIDPYFPKEGLTQIMLFEDKRSYYAGPQHPLSQKRTVTEKDIAKALHVSVGAFYEKHTTSFEIGDASNDGPRIELSGDVSIALHLVATNSYIAALPDFVMQHIIDDRQFVRLPYRGAMPSRMLSIWHSEEIGGRPQGLLSPLVGLSVAARPWQRVQPPAGATPAGALRSEMVDPCRPSSQKERQGLARHTGARPAPLHPAALAMSHIRLDRQGKTVL
jgi:hypothetical protein